jgi:2'-5' RNA ligase
MKRIFIAVKVDPAPALLEMISSLKAALKNDSLKWTEPSNIHITLLFLGETEEKKITEIDSVMKQLCNGFGKFELVLKGAGVFRNFKDPRVLWTGIQYSEEMIRLNKLIVSTLLDAGNKIEERPYNPHLTLGRIKRINDISILERQIQNYTKKEIQRILVSEIILYESILKPEGPIYKPLGIYSLNKT